MEGCRQRAAVETGHRFCGECGSPVEGCPSCGQPVIPGKRFCYSCGQPLTAADAAGAALASAVTGLRRHSTPYHLADGLLDRVASLAPAPAP